FQPHSVTRIGNHIGRTVRLDLATTKCARAWYARVCVEVDLSKPLLGKYMIGDRVFYIKYESIENICYTCGVYGHKVESCPTTVMASETDLGTIMTENACGTNDEEKDIGSWMTVSRRQKKKANKQDNDPQSKQKGKLNGGSRFNILRGEDSNDIGASKDNGIPPKVSSVSDPKVGIESLTDITNKILSTANSPKTPRLRPHLVRSQIPLSQAAKVKCKRDLNQIQR
ncbi:hypothetical protein LINPERPRIM_LOCUS35213, partial [Linum perenne]